MGDWGGLTVDILFMIAELIEIVEDFVSFSSVCATWRAAALRKGSARSLQPAQSLMLPSRYGIYLNTNEFYSFARDKICKFSLPTVTVGEQLYTNGWILKKHRRVDVMRLMHPFSGHVISLPLKTSCGDRFYSIKKAVLSSNPSFFPDDYTLMVIYSSWQYESRDCRLGFWKPGEKEWTVVHTDSDDSFKDIIYCRGQFYAVDQYGVVFVRGSNPTMAVPIGKIPTVQGIKNLNFRLSAKTDSHSLLFIIAKCTKRWDATSFFMVYELDLIGKGGLKEVNDLGAKTIFVNNEHESVCVKHSKFPPGIIEADHIHIHDFPCSKWECRKGCQVTERLHKSGMSMLIHNLKGEEAQNFVHPLESSSIL